MSDIHSGTPEDGEPTREQLREEALRAGAAVVAARQAGNTDPKVAAAALPAALAWLRAEVREADVDASGAAPLPREALRTLLVIFEELQDLLPLAITRLVDDARANARSGISAGVRQQARRDLLARRLLTAEELTSLPREVLIGLAVERFRVRTTASGASG